MFTQKPTEREVIKNDFRNNVHFHRTRTEPSGITLIPSLKYIKKHYKNIYSAIHFKWPKEKSGIIDLVVSIRIPPMKTMGNSQELTLYNSRRKLNFEDSHTIVSFYLHITNKLEMYRIDYQENTITTSNKVLSRMSPEERIFIYSVYQNAFNRKLFVGERNLILNYNSPTKIKTNKINHSYLNWERGSDFSHFTIYDSDIKVVKDIFNNSVGDYILHSKRIKKF